MGPHQLKRNVVLLCVVFTRAWIKYGEISLCLMCQHLKSCSFKSGDKMVQQRNQLLLVHVSTRASFKFITNKPGHNVLTLQMLWLKSWTCTKVMALGVGPNVVNLCFFQKVAKRRWVIYGPNCAKTCKKEAKTGQIWAKTSEIGPKRGENNPKCAKKVPN